MLDDKKWHIWYTQYDESGNEVAGGVYDKEYVNYGSACRIAHKLYGDKPNIKYTIAMRNPRVAYTRTERCDICGSDYSTPERNDGYPILNRIYVQICGEPVFKEKFMGYVFPDRIHKSYRPCPECVERVHNFIENLKSKEETDDILSD